jgi:hypothetical protein
MMHTQKQNKFHGEMKCEKKAYAFYFCQNWTIMTMTPPTPPPITEKYTPTAKFQAYLNIFTCSVEHCAHTDTFKL